MAERTKLWIANTMKKLLSRKPIDKIRVTEICKEAEIERPTFYYHFQDKYDLMAWMICQSAYDTDILDLDSAAKALDQMKKDVIFFKRAYEDNSQAPMWQYMLEYFVTRYTQLAISITHNDILDPGIKYILLSQSLCDQGTAARSEHIPKGTEYIKCGHDQIDSRKFRFARKICDKISIRYAVKRSENVHHNGR